MRGAAAGSRSAGRNHRDADAQRRGLEPRRPGWLHERLRARFADELRGGRARHVRLATAVRSLSSDILRPRQVARFARVRSSARAPAGTRPRPVHRAFQAAAGRGSDGERSVHPGPPKAGRSLAHPPRPHVGGSQVKLSARPPLLLTAAVVSLLAACKPSGEGVVALEGATLIDGTGRAPVADAIILVRDGHIQAVARVNEIPVPSGARVVNLIGKTVIPGLIDSHAHVERWAIERYLAWGVTTVRDLGASSTDSAIALKNDLNLGSVLGPRMFTSGAMIDGLSPTYPTATAVRTRADVRKAVDQRAVAGADYVKVYTKFTADLLPPLMDEASTLRLPVAMHLGKIDALTAARAGVASLEHMAGVVEATTGNPGPYFRAHDQFLRGWTLEEEGWALLDSAALARTARALAATHVAVVPTLVLHETLSRLDNPTLQSRPGMEDVPAAAASVRDVAGLLKRTGWRAAEFQAFRRSRAR